ncbi:hypothetical protein HY636_03970 [Candidatus Woesearchaeota archaeon]|nr:hypothetical protein [Candidatus Woesearchaeota archaeon]
MAKKEENREYSSNFDSLENENILKKLSKIDKLIKDTESITGKEFSELLSSMKEKMQLKKNLFPASIFTIKLGVTECLVRYMKDELGFKYKEISKIIHRSEAVVGIMYRNSLKKYSGKLIKEKANLDAQQDIHIPFSIFSPELTVFESIIIYLKETQGLRFSEIAKLTSRNQRTIWTIYHRATSSKKSKKNDSVNKKNNSAHKNNSVAQNTKSTFENSNENNQEGQNTKQTSEENSKRNNNSAKQSSEKNSQSKNNKQNTTQNEE